MFSMWMAFCQLGLAPSAAVSTLKSEGQRGDDVLGWKTQRLIEQGLFLSLPGISSESARINCRKLAIKFTVQGV
ncbi:hypothetical protein PFLUV_G00255810 [Perca fluviatilis]|uniref:Uncharacterized protein n=1 Tax=Perca fluviatilis TaxID=8168 RepID=A0A6A5DZ41_PERFL|nr:hypothetical protein PFLUV_G00255810 [Perca fluviatilis]